MTSAITVMFLPGLSGTRTFGSRTPRIAGFGVEPGPLDGRRLIPLFELDDDLDSLLLPHRTNSKDRRNVDQADAANLHMVLLQLVPAAEQRRPCRAGAR